MTRPRRMTGKTDDRRTFILEEVPGNTFDGRSTWVARRTMTDLRPYGTLSSEMRSRGCPDRGDRTVIAGATAVNGRHELIIPHPRAWSVTLEGVAELSYDDWAFGMLRTALREAMLLEPLSRRNYGATLDEVRKLAQETLDGMGEPVAFGDVDVYDALAELRIERRRDGRWYY